MESTNSIDIAAPIDRVFALTNDDVCKWSLTAVADEVIEDKNGVGTTFKMTTEDRGKQMVFMGEVVAWTPPNYSRVVLTGDMFDIDVDYTFESIETGTRVTQHSIVTPKGFAKVIFFFVGWLAKKSGCEAQNKELQSLKSYCESNA